MHNWSKEHISKKGLVPPFSSSLLNNLYSHDDLYFLRCLLCLRYACRLKASPRLILPIWDWLQAGCAAACTCRAPRPRSHADEQAQEQGCRPCGHAVMLMNKLKNKGADLV